VSGLRVDHVIYAVDDLEVAADRFRHEFGFGSVVGGRHPDWGTANRIVPLGREYIELVAVVDRVQAAASDFGRPVMEAVASGQRLAGWAVATDDLDGIASRLELQMTSGSRTRPDGSTLRWQLAGVAQALSTGALPFFIQWAAPPELHPGAAAVEHDVRPRGIAWIEVAAENEAMHAWLGDYDLPLRITEAPPTLRAVAISTPTGELVLR
jgi:Glyoxalase-like domain